MRAMRFTLSTALLASMFFVGSAGAGPARTVVGTDPAGDWSSDENLAPIGTSIGQDLTEAAVTMADDGTLEFQIHVAEMPDFDPTLSGFYSWGFRVGKQARSLTSCGNFLDDCESRENFAVIGDCTYTETSVGPQDVGMLDCERLGEVPATYSPDGVISIPVPLEMLQVSPGTTLKMKKHYVWAAPYSFVFAGPDPSAYNYDWMKLTENFTVTAR
ncbi:MAG: hypothetical protein ACRDLB_00900 [Actinomycetota bacterium]